MNQIIMHGQALNRTYLDNNRKETKIELFELFPSIKVRFNFNMLWQIINDSNDQFNSIQKDSSTH